MRRAIVIKNKRQECYGPTSTAIINSGYDILDFNDVELMKDYDYLAGVDFSVEAIKFCRKKFAVEKERFHRLDALNFLARVEYKSDVIICTEVLEHIDEDLAMISLIQKGTKFLATVPDFGGESHVRHFKTIDEIKQRYDNCLQIDEIISFKGKHTIFLIIAKVK